MSATREAAAVGVSPFPSQLLECAERRRGKIREILGIINGVL